MYLYDHPNPHAPVRSNGIRFWGYPERNGGLDAIDVVVVHTAENVPDLKPPDAGAENVAAYQARTDRPSSYHRIFDADSTVTNLPDAAVAFGARGANTVGLHGSFACRAAQWPSLPSWWVDGALAQAAVTFRQWADAHRIPVVRLTRAEYLAGKRGFVAHADVDPDRRTDPGASFPWPRLLDLVRHSTTQEHDVINANSPKAVIEQWQHTVSRLLFETGGDYDGGGAGHSRNGSHLEADGVWGTKTQAAGAEAVRRTEAVLRHPLYNPDPANITGITAAFVADAIVLLRNPAPAAQSGPSTSELDARYARKVHEHTDVELTISGRVQ